MVTHVRCGLPGKFLELAGFFITWLILMVLQECASSMVILSYHVGISYSGLTASLVERLTEVMLYEKLTGWFCRLCMPGLFN